jgi:poly-beta-1,6-N-acetyl-D-glucosamine synthase
MMKYYIITPAKNEEKYIALTLESMVHQTLKPIEWIIVDDGSTDNTRAIVEKYQQENSWIKIISLDTRQEKKLYGSKVIRAFNHGYNLIKGNSFDFIVKLDADLTLPHNYFEEIAHSFAANKKNGICGGYLIEKEKDYERKIAGQTYVQGPIKAVRAECFKDIGGFVEANGWDGLDQLKALYLGWEVVNLPLKVIHHRIQTTEYRSLKFFENNGIAHYRTGNDIFLTLIRTLVSIIKKPYILASISYFTGYVKAALAREPKLVDKELAKFIRNYHYKRLLYFKR